MGRLARLIALAAVLLLTACGKEPLYQEQGYVFGTLVDVSIYGEDEARARQAASDVLHEFQRLHDMLHAWRPSELSVLNAAFVKGENKDISPELEAMLQDAAQLSQQSRGTFNPAIGKLVELWGFHADEFKPAQPDETQVAQLVANNPQMSDIVFGQGKVQSRNPAVQLDLGGYAKGYALDRAAILLKQRGVRHASTLAATFSRWGSMANAHGASASSIRANPARWQHWNCMTAKRSAPPAITSATLNRAASATAT